MKADCGIFIDISVVLCLGTFPLCTRSRPMMLHLPGVLHVCMCVLTLSTFLRWYALASWLRKDGLTQRLRRVRRVYVPYPSFWGTFVNKRHDSYYPTVLVPTRIRAWLWSWDDRDAFWRVGRGEASGSVAV